MSALRTAVAVPVVAGLWVVVQGVKLLDNIALALDVWDEPW
jgi:hypothetical protein